MPISQRIFVLTIDALFSVAMARALRSGMLPVFRTRTLRRAGHPVAFWSVIALYVWVIAGSAYLALFD